MGFAIRRAHKSDIPAICRIAESLYLNIPGFYWHKKETVTEAVKGGEYHVATQDGLVVGILWLWMSDDDELVSIEALAVAKKERGSNIGRKLVGFAAAFARKRGKKGLYAGSFCKYRAKIFYIKMGFRLVGTKTLFGHKCHCFTMAV
jgi:N-acetylglutamate synthase-like GNAT family acetyltransferase